MFEVCPMSLLKNSICAHCFIAEGRKYCGRALGINEISKMTKCPPDKKRDKKDIKDKRWE